MKTSTVIWIVIIILVVVGLGWWWVGQAPAAAPAQTGAAAGATDQNMPDTGVIASTSPASSVTVTFDGTTFSPASVTVPVGGTVNWVDTSGQMWIASNPHPVHTGYDGTSLSQHCAAGYTGPAPLDQCASGSSFSFTFTKAGTWGYHDHLNHGAIGTVVVQ